MLLLLVADAEGEPVVLVYGDFHELSGLGERGGKLLFLVFANYLIITDP